MEWYQKAKLVMNAKGLRQADLSRRLNEGKENISRYLSGNRGSDSIQTAARFADALGVDLKTLLTEEYVQEDSPLGVQQEPAIYKPLKVNVKLVGNLASEIPAEDIPIEDYYAAPLVTGRIAAGAGAIVEEDIKSLVWIYAPELRNRRRHNLVAIQLDRSANSMKPTLYPGDIVLIDRDEPQSALDFKSGKIYAVRLKKGEDDCAIKRVHKTNGNLIIFSDNRKYPPEASYTCDVKELILGRVVWGWRNLLEI